MRALTHAVVVVGSSGVLAAACAGGRSGASDLPRIEVDTRIARPIYAAGERIDARCTLVDDRGEPALDADGNPLADTTELVITYRNEDSFAIDDEGEVMAARGGRATVWCSAPSLDLVDREPAEIEIVAGPARRAFTELEREVAIAGQPVGVNCLAFDGFANRVEGVEHSLALSPSGAGTQVVADSVAASIAGEYEVTCVVIGAAEVEEAFLSVLPGPPASLLAGLVPERAIYTVGEQVALVAEARDGFGNRVDGVTLAYSSSPALPSPSEARFLLEKDGACTLTVAVVPAPPDDTPLVAVSLPLIVDSAGPAIQCMRIDSPGVASDAYMLQAGPSTVVFPVRVLDTFDVQSVTIDGTPAALGSSGNFEAGVSVEVRDELRRGRRGRPVRSREQHDLARCWSASSSPPRETP